MGGSNWVVFLLKWMIPAWNYLCFHGLSLTLLKWLLRFARYPLKCLDRLSGICRCGRVASPVKVHAIHWSQQHFLCNTVKSFLLDNSGGINCLTEIHFRSFGCGGCLKQTQYYPAPFPISASWDCEHWSHLPTSSCCSRPPATGGYILRDAKPLPCCDGQRRAAGAQTRRQTRHHCEGDAKADKGFSRALTGQCLSREESTGASPCQHNGTQRLRQVVARP